MKKKKLNTSSNGTTVKSNSLNILPGGKHEQNIHVMIELVTTFSYPKI